MKTIFILFTVLLTILISGTFSTFIINNVFAQDISVNNDDSETSKKQKEIEQKKDEQQKRIEEKQKEIEQKKDELDTYRENLEKKQLEESKIIQKKIKEIKAQLQNKMERKISNDLEKPFQQYDEKLTEKSKEIQENLAKKLDLRTKNILENIDNGKYMGEKITQDNSNEKYELVFDSVDAYLISNKSNTSSLTGKMTFTTFDQNQSNLKLELDGCSITVDQIIYNCGFGKARTTFAGESKVGNSLVIIAFLEDDVLGEIHSTLKIFLNSDMPINAIEQSKVSILGPQSKISSMWFLNGTATMSKIIQTSENNLSANNSTMINEDEISLDVK